MTYNLFACLETREVPYMLLYSVILKPWLLLMWKLILF